MPHRPQRQTLNGLMTAPMLLSILANCAAPPTENEATEAAAAEVRAPDLRIALFNVKELGMDKLDRVGDDGRGVDEQLLAMARILAEVQPDVLIVQEIDAPPEPPHELPVILLRDRYLRPADDGLNYPYVFSAPSNTGELSGLDLDGDGRVATASDLGERAHGNDSWGYGVYPGQYGMAVLSKLPLRGDLLRSFRQFLWSDLPGNHLPADFYGDEIAGRLRLSSKSHWDLPLEVPDADGATRSLHLLVSHPTPPGFDGDEDRNGRRNFDEIAFWARYIDDPPEAESWLIDDQGVGGGLGAGERFVLVGDLNARPFDVAAELEKEDGDGWRQPVYEGRSAISQLLEHPRVADPGNLLSSAGALENALIAEQRERDRASTEGRSADSVPPVTEGAPDYPERSTAGFRRGARIDYLLPSAAGLEIVDGGVWWPARTSDVEAAELAETASDHRLIWLDLRLTASSP